MHILQQQRGCLRMGFWVWEGGFQEVRQKGMKLQPEYLKAERCSETHLWNERTLFRSFWTYAIDNGKWRGEKLSQITFRNEDRMPGKWDSVGLEIQVKTEYEKDCGTERTEVEKFSKSTE